METTYFVLGMLSVIAVIFAVTVIWGVVKIFKLSIRTKQQNEELNNLSRTLWENHGDLREDLNRRMIETDRNIYSHVDNISRELDSRFKDMYDEIGHTRSYIDSRIDKVTGTLSAKHVIKG